MKDDKSKQCNVSLQAFYDHFKEIYSENSDFLITKVYTFIENNFSQNNKKGANGESNTSMESLDSPLTNAEVMKAFLKLKRNKSPGLDLLPPEIFFDSSDLLCEPICKVFNYIFQSNMYPLSRMLTISGITLTSIVSKLYSHVLDSRLRSWTEDNNILNDNHLVSKKTKARLTVYSSCNL